MSKPGIKIFRGMKSNAIRAGAAESSLGRGLDAGANAP